MINRVVLVGRLTKDPELRYTPNGIASTRFTLAVNRTFTNQQGEKEADFIQCQAWRKQAENLANFMKKGSLIGVEGRIQTGSYEGQDGKRVYTTDVVCDSIQFLESRGGGEPQQQPQNNNMPGHTGNNAPGAYTPPQQSYNPGEGGGYAGNNAPSYTRVDEDPFANRKGPIEVSEDDLPF